MTHFKFITPVFNCENKIDNTLFSMLSQSYKDWSAVFVNDLSTDNTPHRLRSIIQSLPDDLKNRISVVDNEEKQGEVVNTLQHTNSIIDTENTVVVRLDGGDWLTESDILYILNEIYKDPLVDVAWTNHRWSFTNYNISSSIKLSDEFPTVYHHPWVSSHLKTFRSSRLLKVPDTNFRDVEGNYITIACDQAVFLPMLHQTVIENRKAVHVPICAYHYDINLNDPGLFTQPRSYAQKSSAEFIRVRGYLS